MRIRLPAVQHARDAEGSAGHAQRAAHTVRSGKQFVVERLRDHHLARLGLVVRCGPAVAVQERRVEHREEIRRGVTRLHVERVERGLFGLDRHRAAGHQRLVLRPLRMQQVHAVDQGQLFGRLLARHHPLDVLRIDLRVVQLSAASWQRIARQHVQHGQRRHAGADAQGDRQHHQRGERLVAPEAAQCQVEVVAEHSMRSVVLVPSPATEGSPFSVAGERVKKLRPPASPRPAARWRRAAPARTPRPGPVPVP